MLIFLFINLLYLSLKMINMITFRIHLLLKLFNMIRKLLFVMK